MKYLKTRSQSILLVIDTIKSSGNMANLRSYALPVTEQGNIGRKMNKKLMFSSVRQDWATPQEVFDKLNKEFNFTLDPCCTKRTAKCKKFFTPKINGLKQSWEGEKVFVNPPFGREQAAWIKKGYEESQKPKTIVVFLIPARTDTIAFHKYLYGKAEIRFIKGRLKFINPILTVPKEKWTAAPFPSMIAILRNLNEKSKI